MHVVNQGGPQNPVRADEDLSLQQITDALTGGQPLAPAERISYTRRLFLHALDSRDSRSSALVAHLMDTYPDVDADLEEVLRRALEDHPDSVYAFIRAHLPNNQDERWREWLQLAALYSLRVAINDADADTTVNWLTLIAREPPSYELSSVFHYGLLAARERASADPELARQIVILAARRDRVALEVLLNDPQFLAILPDNLGRILRDLDGDLLSLYRNKGPELFLVALARLTRAGKGVALTPEVVTTIWNLYASGQAVSPLGPDEQPAAIINLWISQGGDSLSTEALEALVSHMLRDRRDDLFVELMHQSRAADRLQPRLLTLLENNDRTINEAVDLVTRVVTAGDMIPQRAADLYVAMLHSLDWELGAAPLMQQLTRMLHQYPNAQVTADELWKLTESSAGVRDEAVARVAVRRLLIELEATADEVELVDALRRLQALTGWSDTVHEYVMNWWREFVRRQPIARLNRLDRAIEGKRGLDEARNSLQTLNAVRRMINSRSLGEFAGDIRAAYEVLAALSEAFDPGTRRILHFDPLVARAELDSREDQVSPQQRQVLANHLKELAELVATMGDNRTRATLMRRSNDLDHELMSGEQTPQGAVDTMKWLAGYWDGAQETDTTGE